MVSDVYLRRMKDQRQEKIFKEWMTLHKGLVFKVVRAYANDSQDQEDLFQEIAKTLWESIPNFKRQSADTTWIYRVALFAAMAWNRKEQRHRKSKRFLHNAADMLEGQPAKPDPRLAWLYEQISELPNIDRSLTLLFLDGYSYKEMAEMLGLSESNVGVKINRIKIKLTKQSIRMEEPNYGT